MDHDLFCIKAKNKQIFGVTADRAQFIHEIIKTHYTRKNTNVKIW